MRLKLIGLAAAIAGTLLTAAPSLAQQQQQQQQPAPPPATAGQLATARELIQVTGALASVDEMLPTLTEEIRKQGVTRPDIVKDLDDVLRSLQPELALLREQITQRACQSYAKFLTEAEMKDALAFFRTPSGAKYAAVQNDITDDLIRQVRNWTQEASEYTMVRARAELLKRGHQM